jgi:hypothetical protein
VVKREAAELRRRLGGDLDDYGVALWVEWLKYLRENAGQR